MKKLVLGLAVLGGVLFTSAQESSSKPKCEHSQCCKGGKQSKQDRVEKMKKDLNLSDAQVKKINKLYEKEQDVREKDRAKDKSKTEARKEKHRSQMKSILTEEQYQKWEENMKRMKSIKKINTNTLYKKE